MVPTAFEVLNFLAAYLLHAFHVAQPSALRSTPIWSSRLAIYSAMRLEQKEHMSFSAQR